MNPTPEQVAQWAREAQIAFCLCKYSSYELALVTRAMAEQAEADAKELVATSEYKAGYRDGYNRCNDEIKGLLT